MKLKLGILLLFFISITLSSFIVIKEYQAKKNPVSVFYEKNIDILPIGRLKNLRYLNEVEKKALYEKLNISDIFSIDTITASLKTISEPHIILWLTDHFGQVPAKGLEWYCKNVFSQFANRPATFWLIDLAAWRYLAIKEEQLPKEKSFESQECPLFLDKSDLFTQALESVNKIKFLRASDFFCWLSTCDLQLSLPSQLIRDDLRSGAGRFSLRQLGFNSPLLTCYAKNGRPYTDIDNTQIFPLLQYLEALYYALTIIKENENKKSCNIVFLLPIATFIKHDT